MKEKKISFYRNFGSVGEEVSLEYMLGAIKEGAYRKQIEALRQLNEEDYGKQKKKLPHFTPSGTFNMKRSSETLAEYSQIIILDIDKISDAESVRNRAAKIKHTMTAFLSPSGRGLKILVNTTSVLEDHKRTFNEVVSFYEKVLGVTVDAFGKDVSRACFVSYDPNLYLNEDSEVFQVQTITEIPKFNSISTTIDDDLFDKVVTFTQNVKHYYPGDRNNFIYLLANNLNRCSVSIDEAELKISVKYSDLDKNEIQTAIKSAYRNTNEHGVLNPEYLNSASSVNSAKVVKPKMGSNTPLIPEEVYEYLPDFLRKDCQLFNIKRERDVFLTSALVLISGCFNNVYGIYDNREYHSNLNCLIIAPPGSGKGVMDYARNEVQKIHDCIVEKFESTVPLERTNIQRTHFIPANSSSALVMKVLKLNNELGTICETEADTLSGTLKQEWGDYSDMIRKAFHHEPITYGRVGNSEDIVLGEIKRPKLSICLTGTPSQIPALLKSTEDGLFSRIIFYTYRNDEIPVFKDVFSDDGNVSFTKYFENKSEELYNYNLKVKGIGPVMFQLTKEQKVIFQERFDKTVKRIYHEYGEDTRSIVNRLGLITFRITMILTILRKLEKDELTSEVICKDVDFDASFLLSNIYLEHALEVYQSLLGRTVKNKSNADKFLDILPNKFKHSEAVKIGKLIANISEKTVSNYLRKLKETDLLKQPNTYGEYWKK